MSIMNGCKDGKSQIKQKMKSEHLSRNKAHKDMKDFEKRDPKQTEDPKYVLNKSLNNRLGFQNVEQKDLKQQQQIKEVADCFEQELEQDSDYQFSEEIMKNNPKKQTRQVKEKAKLNHLAIFDWMSKISTMLHMTKEGVYRAVINLKKFMYLQQKLPNSRVTLANANLYALASLLISSKYENCSGNFLAHVTHIESNSSHLLEKSAILDCQMYILTTLRFQIFNRIYLVQDMLQVVQAWNQVIKNSKIFYYTISRCDRLLDRWQLGKIQQDEEGDLLQIFLHLVDFVLMRKLVEIKVKDIKLLDNPGYFKRLIVNILYQLLYYTINQSIKQNKQKYLKQFQNTFKIFALEKLRFQKTDLLILQRQSHLLAKQMRAIYTSNTTQNSPKLQTLQKISTLNKSQQLKFCLCHLANQSKKYQNIFQPQNNQIQIFQKQEISSNDPSFKISQSELQCGIQLNKVIQIQKDKSNFCPKCIKDIKLLGSLINQQFHLSLLYKRQ